LAKLQTTFLFFVFVLISLTIFAQPAEVCTKSFTRLGFAERSPDHPVEVLLNFDKGIQMRVDEYHAAETPPDFIQLAHDMGYPLDSLSVEAVKRGVIGEGDLVFSELKNKAVQLHVVQGGDKLGSAGYTFFLDEDGNPRTGIVNVISVRLLREGEIIEGKTIQERVADLSPLQAMGHIFFHEEIHRYQHKNTPWGSFMKDANEEGFKASYIRTGSNQYNLRIRNEENFRLIKEYYTESKILGANLLDELQAHAYFSSKRFDQKKIAYLWQDLLFEMQRSVPDRTKIEKIISDFQTLIRNAADEFSEPYKELLTPDVKNAAANWVIDTMNDNVESFEEYKLRNE
jgi:hypothetical protein